MSVYHSEVIYLQNQDAWGEHKQFTRYYWKCEVANNATQLGYWEWVDEQLEEETYLQDLNA